jgi:hypothetical protein
VSIEEFLFTSGLDPKSHDVIGIHALPPAIFGESTN